MTFTGNFIIKISVSVFLLFWILHSQNVPHVDAVSQQTITKTLYDDLMTGYDSNLIPVCDSGGNVTLNIDMALRQIMEMNEREQILSTNIWMRLTWNDCRLQWDPASYSNLTYLMLKYEDVWVPDITLYDSAADEVMFPGFENFRAYVSSSGSVTYNFPTVATSICRVNVKYFPFDVQECSLQFGSWSHHGYELDVVNRNPTGDLDSYIQNAEWEVDSLPVTRSVLYYNCCPEPYPDVTFSLIMARRPAFYLLTMIFPCILTSCVAALAFVLPVESGEKVSLEITVLLSLAVFLLLVSESLPPSSDNFPIIGSYFASSMVLVSLSLVQSVLVLNAFYRGTTGRKVPRWARIVFFKYLGRILCMKSNKVDPGNSEQKMRDDPISTIDSNFDQYVSTLDQQSKDSPELHDPDIPNGKPFDKPVKRNGILPGFVYKDSVAAMIKEQTTHVKMISEHFDETKREEEINSEWRDLSNVLDRVFLILYMLVNVITTLAFILQCL